MDVEYDPKKAQINWQKHGVSFAEAEFVFYDPLAIHDIDPDASEEERFMCDTRSHLGSGQPHKDDPG
ncbi:MAG: BrnT family toxin, partial [Halothece sp.]